jgi:hypothetical protein
LAAVVVAAAVFVCAASAANSTSFPDAAGDTRSAPDITGVTISNDDGGLVTIRVSIANRTGLAAADEIDVGIDADQSPDTGSAFYGGEAEFDLSGSEATFWLPGSDGYYHKSVAPASLQAGFTGGAAIFSFKASELGITAGFNVYVTAFGKVGGDLAPDIRTFNHQLVAGTVPPPLTPDRRAPLDEAVKTTGVHGKVAFLSFYVADGRAETSETIRVLRGNRLLKRIVTQLEDSNPFVIYDVRWQVPRNVRGKLRFCVSSVDRAGNRGAASCAPLTIR